MGYNNYVFPEYRRSDRSPDQKVRIYTGKQLIDEPWKDFYGRHRESPEAILIKTHEWRTDELPAIYVVRDGRKALYSYFHYHRNSHSSAGSSGLLELVLGADWFGSWSDHYNAWHSFSQPRLATFRYEELINADAQTLRRLGDFIGHQGGIASWDNPFKEMHALFPTHYREGKAEWLRPAEWTDLVDRAFWSVHGDLMRKLGYGAGEAPEIPEAERQDWRKLALIARERTAHQRELAKLQASHTEVVCNLNSRRWARQHVSNLEKAIPKLWKAPRDWFWHQLMDTNRCQPGSLWQYKPRRYGTFYRPRQARKSLEHTPSFAMVVPSFNQADYILHSVRSILDQEHPRLQLAVMDGGSQDGTQLVLESLESRFAAYRSRKDEGQAAAINEGMGRIEGTICGWLNSDDMLLPGTLALVGRYFAAHPEVDAVYGYRLIIDSQGFEIGRWFMPPHRNEDLRWFDYVPQETLFFRRSLWDRVGGLTAEFQFAMDWDLLIRFIDAGAKIVRLPYFLGAFRAHHEQKTSLLMSTAGQWEMAAIRKKNLGRVPAPEEIKKRQLDFRGRASLWAHFYKRKIRF